MGFVCSVVCMGNLYVGFHLSWYHFRLIVQETYEIEDCIIYDTTTYSTDTIKAYSDIPTNFKCIYTAKRPSGVAWVEIGSDSSNNVFGGIVSDRGWIGAYSRKNGSYEAYQSSSESISTGEHEITLTFNNGVLACSSENLSTQINNSTITSRNWQKIHLTGSGGYIKNIKIKPL